MSIYRLLAIAAGIGISGAALAAARQGLPEEPPFDLAPDPYVESPFGELPPEGGAAPSSPDPDQALGQSRALHSLSQSGPPPVGQPSQEFEVGAPDSRAFIDQGIAQAERAIEALAEEREGLRSRIEKIEAELARWEAVNRGLLAARQARPGATPAESPPPSAIGEPELAPLTSEVEGVALPPSDAPALLPPRSFDSTGPPPLGGFDEN